MHSTTCVKQQITKQAAATAAAAFGAELSLFWWIVITCMCTFRVYSKFLVGCGPLFFRLFLGTVAYSEPHSYVYMCTSACYDLLHGDIRSVGWWYSFQMCMFTFGVQRIGVPLAWGCFLREPVWDARPLVEPYEEVLPVDVVALPVAELVFGHVAVRFGATRTQTPAAHAPSGSVFPSCCYRLVLSIIYCMYHNYLQVAIIVLLLFVVVVVVCAVVLCGVSQSWMRRTARLISLQLCLVSCFLRCMWLCIN